MSDNESSSSPESPSGPLNLTSEIKNHEPHSLEKFLCISPIERRRLHIKSYKLDKFNEIQKSVKTKFEDEFGKVPESSTERIIRDYDSMLNRIKERFEKEQDRGRKKELLALLPSSWSCSQIREEFNCPKNLILASRKSKSGVNETESAPSEKRSRGNQSLSTEIEQHVVEFYESEENSMQLSGIEDVKTVTQADGTTKLIQKKLVLRNLRELHRTFMERYPNMKVGMSKFASLRPEHCVLARSRKQWNPHFLDMTDS